VIRRRAFIAGLGGSVVCSLSARAQRAERVRRIGVLMAFNEVDAASKAFLAAFTQGLPELGWSDGRNVQINVRWGGDNVDRMRMLAKEVVDLQPDVILSHGTSATAALQRATPTIPIVFAVVSDPVGAGFVAGLPRPGGNLTGFINLEAAMGGKWLGLLTEIAPGIKRAAAMFNPETAAGAGSYFVASFEAAARSLKITPITSPVYSEVDIGTVINTLGSEPRAALVAMPNNFMLVHRTRIISLAARNNVPAVGTMSFLETAV
jgi:putative ABC transport system substrate-binding protein